MSFQKVNTITLIFLSVASFVACRHDAIVPDDNYYKTDCDTAVVTYENFVKGFMTDKSCILCHCDEMGYTPYLDNHDSIRLYVADTAKAMIFIGKIETNHKIVDSVRLNTPCETAKFRQWIRSGAQ